MDRTFEDLRHEVLELDRESQGKLVEEIEQQWSAEIDDGAFVEARRRLDAYHRGEMGSVSGEEATMRVRKVEEGSIIVPSSKSFAQRNVPGAKRNFSSTPLPLIPTP
ncbi:MAG TPA: addiction module protein [Candidatus Kapabacteria bacterium]|nr:addiction module protein [Candidatus Kapabacteria bacterium]